MMLILSGMPSGGKLFLFTLINIVAAAKSLLSDAPASCTGEAWGEKKDFFS